MKKLYLILNLLFCLIFVSCDEQNQQQDDVIKFGICADYPPFEYVQNDSFAGFDIDLAKLIAKKMGKKAEFVEMSFNTIFQSIQSGMVDAGISTINSSPEREKSFSFSIPYYYGDIAVLYRQDTPLPNISMMYNHKIAVQLGTMHENWAIKNIPDADLHLKKSTIHSVESLKVKQIDGVILDAPQAVIFVEKNEDLAFATIDKDDSGFTIAFRKGSPLKEKVDKIITELKNNGEIEQLEMKHITSLGNE
jgi:polar amino acid transport system substrate-binding protein